MKQKAKKRMRILRQINQAAERRENDRQQAHEKIGQRRHIKLQEH
ncbi:hypothetical protein [Marinobacter sp. NFXS9]